MCSDETRLWAEQLSYSQARDVYKRGFSEDYDKGHDCIWTVTEQINGAETGWSYLDGD